MWFPLYIPYIHSCRFIVMKLKAIPYSIIFNFTLYICIKPNYIDIHSTLHTIHTNKHSFTFIQFTLNIIFDFVTIVGIYSVKVYVLQLQRHGNIIYFLHFTFLLFGWGGCCCRFIIFFFEGRILTKVRMHGRGIN